MKKSINTYSQTINMYFGYYHSTLIAVGENKDVVELYLTNHRHIHKGEYTIEKRCILESDLYIRYDDENMVEWNGYIIPTVDILLIDLYSRDIISEIDETIQNLKHLALLSEGVKKIPPNYITHLVDSIRTLNEMRIKSKIIRKLEYREKLDNSILYDNIDNYLRLKSHVTEMRDAKTRWFEYE